MASVDNISSPPNSKALWNELPVDRQRDPSLSIAARVVKVVVIIFHQSTYFQWIANSAVWCLSNSSFLSLSHNMNLNEYFQERRELSPLLDCNTPGQYKFLEHLFNNPALFDHLVGFLPEDSIKFPSETANYSTAFYITLYADRTQINDEEWPPETMNTAKYFLSRIYAIGAQKAENWLYLQRKNEDLPVNVDGLPVVHAAIMNCEPLVEFLAKYLPKDIASETLLDDVRAKYEIATDMLDKHLPKRQ